MLTCSKRLRKELESLKSNPDPLIQLSVKDDNIREWVARIRGPDDSPYENYCFDLAIMAGNDYPLTPPAIKFLSKIFHPNVHFDVRTRIDHCDCVKCCYALCARAYDGSACTHAASAMSLL